MGHGKNECTECGALFDNYHDREGCTANRRARVMSALLANDPSIAQSLERIADALELIALGAATPMFRDDPEGLLGTSTTKPTASRVHEICLRILARGSGEGGQ